MPRAKLITTNLVLSALSALSVLSGALALGGCIRRELLTSDELARAQKIDPELAESRVYPNHRLRSWYPEENYTADVAIADKKVRIRGTRTQRKRKATRRTAGKIVAIDEFNGMPLLWVNFDPKCIAEPLPCAYAFVLTEYGRYSLVAVPELEGYDAPTSYRRAKVKRNRLRRLHQRKIGEANPVLAVPRKLRKTNLTIDLELRKDSRQRTKTETDDFRRGV